jgi:hypothetical protein
LNHFEYCRQKDSGSVIMLPGIRPNFHAFFQQHMMFFMGYVAACHSGIYPVLRFGLLCIRIGQFAYKVRASYLLFCHASATFPPIERDDRLIRSTSEYSSFFGNPFVTSKTSCRNSKAG